MKKKTIISFALGTALVFSMMIGCNSKKQSTTSVISSNSSQKIDDEIYSIYLLAKSSGYTGTYEEWLASIKGADGSSVLTGVSDPTTSVGKNGDTFINTTSWDVFVKSGGQWAKVGNIMGKEGPKGDPGEPGKDGTSVLTGNGAPSEELGKNGDSYIDLDTWDYYVKENNAWVKKGNIKGDDATPKNEQGLAFYLLDNGTYGVGVGTASQLSNIVIPDTYYGKKVTRIVAYGFSECHLIEKITIPETITEIGEGAFYNCNSLASINIPRSVTKIDNMAFDQSPMLNINYYGSFDNWINLTRNATWDCKTHLFFDNSEKENETVIIPGSIKNIPDYAFSYCSGIKEIVLQNGVESIGSQAFMHCDSLETISIPLTVDTIKEKSFSSCSSLKTISIPDSVVSIEEGIFSDCISLEDLTFSNQVTAIPDYTFYNCKSLSTFNIPNSITEIGIQAFAESALTSITIPNNVISIKTQAFAWCSDLSDVSLGNGILSIGAAAFFECDSLEFISIPDNVTTLGPHCFEYCDALKGVIIGNGVQSIGGRTFGNCLALEYIVFGSSIETISDQPFGGEYSINIKFFYFGNNTDWSNITIFDSMLRGCVPYFYSENEPLEAGIYWRYVNNVPTVWA